MRRRTFIAGALCLGSAALGCDKKSGAAAAGSGGAEGRLRIAVIPKGTTHEFWKAVHAGAAKASKELDVDVVWKGPLKEDDLKNQVDLVQSFTAQGVSGIVLAPLNDKALIASVKGATRAKIPVVIFDSALAGGDTVSFVATDNRAAGRLAGDRMAELVGKDGKVVLLRYQEGSASTFEREEGFLEAIKKHSGITLVSDNQYGGATTETAFSASESLLLAKGGDKGEIGGVFCPNESTTFGMLLALQKAKLTGKIRFIGFDASDKLVQGVKAGEIDALVLQDPFHMGYTAVKTMVTHLRGGKAESRIDTGATLVSKANMEKPEVARLLKPEIDKWLGK
ncbi:MAG: substrate-binding domain-containing protein [Polyangiaceae bacterium]